MDTCLQAITYFCHIFSWKWEKSKEANIARGRVGVHPRLLLREPSKTKWSSEASARASYRNISWGSGGAQISAGSRFTAESPVRSASREPFSPLPIPFPSRPFSSPVFFLTGHSRSRYFLANRRQRALRCRGAGRALQVLRKYVAILEINNFNLATAEGFENPCWDRGRGGRRGGGS